MQPPAYVPSTDFSAEEASNVGGRSTVRTAALDAELAAVQETTDGLRDNLALIQRDDGKLRDGAVEIYSLSATARAALQGQLIPRGDWSSPTAYLVNDLVQVSGISYFCVVAHTSGTFATDLAAGKWLLTSAGSASAAASSATSATTSASVASTKASEASTSASSAGTSATNAAASATASNAARVLAEAARDSINTSGKVFTYAEGTAAGIAATTSGQNFAVLSVDSMRWTVYRNTAGVATPMAASYTSAYLDALVTPISENNQLGGGAQIEWGVVDNQNRVPLALLPSGKMLLDIDDTSRAWSAIKSLMALTGTATALGADNVFTGASPSGSPASALAAVYAAVDSAGRVGLALLADGTLWIGKYDANLAAAVAAAAAPTEYFAASGGQIIKYTGHGQSTLTSLGTNSTPYMTSSGKVQFLSDRMRGLLGGYQMSKDGSLQRLVLGSRAYEIVFVTGQSLAVGSQAATLSLTAPYSTNALKLTGTPVLDTPATRDPAAVLVPLVEVTNETVSTSFAAALLDRELAQRASLKQVVVGNGYSGQPYSAIKKGTATYNDVIAQIARVVTFGSSVVRAGIIIHGESDNANVAYAANLAEWQADYEADVKATTGQTEPVFLLICQTASIRWYFPSNLTGHKSALAQLDASEANTKIILAVPEYIFTFPDDLHIDGPSQRLMGEYVEKAYRSVCIEGKDWRAVSPRTYTLGANFVDIQFWVPVAPLVLDTALCTDPGNYGFSYSDAAGRTITDVALKGGTTDTVRVTLSGAPGATAVIDYAYSNGTASKSGKTAGARGCLRDSDTAVSRWNSATHLYNPCVIFRKALN